MRDRFRTAVVRRDAVSHVCRRELLGLTPQATNLRTDEERGHRRSLDARDVDVYDYSPDSESCFEEPLAILAIEAKERAMELERFMATLPPDQHALCELRVRGVGPTEALRQLGLPKSTDTALRGRIARYREKREETG